MKFNRFFYILILLIFTTKIHNFDTLLSINIMEATNLHCKLNNELFCNPYAEISFKYSTVSKTTKFSVCTKSPYFNSKFLFEPEICDDEEIYISLYQYMTPRDSNFLQEKAYDEQYYDKGDIKPGYLGRVVLKLKHLPFGISEDWYMVEENLINDRVVFPSCVKLRISYTSKKCNEGSSLYKLNMLDNGQFFKHLGFKLDFRLPKNFDDLLEDMKRKKKLVKNKLNYNVESILLPRCKVEFTSIYRNTFTKLKASTGQKLDYEDSSTYDPNEEYDYRSCTADPNKDYGFEHKSQLTFIEESIVFKIIKRVTGKDVFSTVEKENQIQTNFKEFNYENYDEFYKKECYEKNLTIEEINAILKEECSNFPLDTKNPYIDKAHNPDKQPSYPEKLTRLRLNNEFSNALESYISAENTNYMNNFNDDYSIISSTNKISEILKKIEETNKEDETMFDHKNQVKYSINGDINEKERNILRIYALYKWNGGHLEYSTIKREFYLRRKYFKCYEQVKIVPTNILNHFTEDKCPDNYVCLDPNGNIILSDGKDPKEIFKEDLKNNGVDLFDVDKILKAREAKIKRNVKITQNIKYPESNKKSLEQRNQTQSSKNSENLNRKDNNTKELSKNKVSKSNVLKTSFIQITDDKFDEEKLINKNDFLRLLIEESGEQFNNNSLLSYNISSIFLNKFDKMYFSRRNRIKNKKTVITSKVFDCIPIIGEMLQLSSMDQILLEEKIDPNLIKKELTAFKKYLLLYDANGNYIDKASKILLNLVLCRVDYYKLRNLMNDLLEGLCYGDPISMKIYREILHHVILDTLFKLSFFELEDIEAKVNLIQTFNKKFCIPTFKKVTFVENMLLLKEVKQQIIFMIINTDSNEKVSLRLNEVKKAIPMIVNNNKRELEFDKNGNLIKDNANYSNHFVQDLKNNIVFESKDYLKELQYGAYKFKEINSNLEDIFNEIIPLLNSSHMNEINKSIDEEFKDFDMTKDLKESNENLQLSNNNVKSKNSKFRFKQEKNDVDEANKINSEANLNNDGRNKGENLIYTITKTSQTQIPSDDTLIREIVNKPDVKKILKEENAKINIIPNSNDIKSTYQIQKVTTKTVEKKNKTKELIIKNLMSENEFNDLVKQGKDYKETPDSKLYNILNKIQNKPCSNGYLCVEIGTITGDFESLKDKKYEVKIKKSENVNLIVKPIVIKPEKKIEKKIENQPQNNDDCLDGNVLNELSENKSK